MDPTKRLKRQYSHQDHIDRMHYYFRPFLSLLQNPVPTSVSAKQVVSGETRRVYWLLPDIATETTASLEAGNGFPHEEVLFAS